MWYLDIELATCMKIASLSIIYIPDIVRILNKSAANL